TAGAAGSARETAAGDTGGGRTRLAGTGERVFEVALRGRRIERRRCCGGRGGGARGGRLGLAAVVGSLIVGVVVVAGLRLDGLFDARVYAAARRFDSRGIGRQDDWRLDVIVIERALRLREDGRAFVH